VNYLLTSSVTSWYILDTSSVGSMLFRNRWTIMFSESLRRSVYIITKCMESYSLVLADVYSAQWVTYM